MTNVTYGSLFTDIETKYKSIQEQRGILSQRRKAGEKSIEHLRRVHPRTTPRFWYDRLARIKGIKSEFGTLSSMAKKIDVSEAELKKQEKLLKEKQSAGWKIRKKDEGYQFYKPAPKVSSSGGSAGGGFSVRVKWRTKSGEVKSFQGNIKGNWASQISQRGGTVLSVESLGRGRNVKKYVPEAKETVGGGLLLYEYKPEEVKTNAISDVKDVDVQEIDIVTGRPMPMLDTSGGKGVQVGELVNQPTTKSIQVQPRGDASAIPEFGTKKTGDVWITPEKSTTWKWGDPSPYLTEHGYDPKDFDFTTEIQKTTGKIGQTETAITNVEKSLPIITKNIESIETMLADIKVSDQKEWKFQGVANVFDKEGATAYLQEKLKEQKTTLQSYQKALPEMESSLTQMKEAKTTLIDYKGKGYTLDVKEGAYEFGLPSAVDVHKYVYAGKIGYKEPELWEKAGALVFPPIGLAMSTKQVLAGKDAHATQLSMGSLIQSPLGIGAVASGVASAITGDEGYTKRSQEKIAEFSLGLKSSLKKGGLAYTGKVISSGAVVSGVILPTVTLGTGYVLTGVGAGASGVTGATATTLGKFGATTLGKVSVLGAKGGLVSLGSVGVVTTGATLLRTGVESPYDLPSAIAETGFTVGLAYGSFKAGGKLFKSRLPKIKTVDVKATDLKVIQEAPEGGVTKFELYGKYDVGGVKADVMFKGAGYKVGKDLHVTAGRGSMSYTSKGSIFKRLTGIGKEKSFYKILDADTTAKLVVKTPKENIYFSKGTSQLLSGKKGYYAYGVHEPVGGKGFTNVLKQPFGEKGTTNIFKEMFTGKVYPKEHGIKLDLFKYGGKYSGMFQKGTVKLSGRIFRFTKISKDGGAKPVSIKGLDAGKGGSLTTQEYAVDVTGDYGITAKVIGQVVAKSMTKDIVTAPPTGVSAGGLGGLVVKQKQPIIKDTGKIQLTTSKTELSSSLRTKPVSIVAQESKTKTDTRLKSILSLSVAKAEKSVLGTREMTIQGTGLKQIDRFDTLTTPAIDTAQAQIQKQKLSLAQKSKMAYETAQESIFDTTPLSDIEPITPLTPIPILWDSKEVKPKKKAKVGRPRKRPYKLGKKRIALKTVLADPFSVQTSQIKYGKATTPKVTKKIWEEFQRTGKVKTVEMRQAEKKAKKDKINFDYSSKGGATKGDKVTFDFNFINKKKKKKKKGGKK